MLNNVIIPKCKSMKISDYFEYVKCEYVYLELIVTKANKNNNTEQIATLVNEMYQKANKYICQDSKKLVIEQRAKASFYIHITKDKVQFFFIIPKMYLNKFKVKFQNCWKNIEIVEVDNIPIDANSCSKFDVHYENNNSLSIAVDKRNNDLLNSNMSIVNMLEENEVVGIFYNFIPTSERENNYFKSKIYKNEIKDYKSGKNPKMSKTKKDYAIIALKFCIDFINDLLNAILNKDKKGSKVISYITKETSYSTNKKVKSDICKSQIILLTKSDGEGAKKRENELGRVLANTFEEIKDDNKLIVTKITKDIDIKKNKINHVKVNKTTVEEDSNFISMPSLEVINQFGMIKHNKTAESPVPKELTTGIVNLGINKYKDTHSTSYLNNTEPLKCLPHAIMGGSRSGKTTFSINTCKNIIDAGEGLIVPDFIKNTEFAEKVKRITPKERLIDIDLSIWECIQAMAYNELKITEGMKAGEINKIARRKASMSLELINIMNNDEKQLPPKMRKYLGAAARVAFCFNNSSMRDAIRILQIHTVRHEFINKLSDELKKLLEDSIISLYELDEYSKATQGKEAEIIGTKDTKIEGIIDRIDLFRENDVIDAMFSKDPTDNIDFVDAMNEGKVILIRMRDKDFDDEVSKDVLTTFFIQKIWLATKIRGTDEEFPNKVTVVIDEVFQVPTAQKILTKTLLQSAKFGLKYMLTLHNLEGLSKEALASLKGANTSYTLISGVDKKAFEELEKEFSVHGYCVEDLLNLKQYTALHLVKTNDGYKAFITHLPKEIKIDISKQNVT